MSCSAQGLLLHLLIESLCPFFIYYCQLKSRFDIYKQPPELSEVVCRKKGLSARVKLRNQTINFCSTWWSNL